MPFGTATFGDVTFGDETGAVVVPPDLDPGQYSAEDILAMIVKDLPEEANLTQGENGFTVTRQFLVTDVNCRAEDRLYAARFANGIPNYGDVHPGVPKCYADTIAVKPEQGQTTSYRVIVSYKTPTPGKSQGGAAKTFPVIRGGSSLNQVTTNKGFAKDKPSASKPELLTVSFAPTTQDEDIQEHTAEISKLVPQSVLTFQRKEGFDPTALSLDFTGRLNKDKWRGLPANTVMCTGIEFQSNDGGVTYDTTYQFQYNRDGWEQDVYFVKTDGKLLSETEIEESLARNQNALPVRTFIVYGAISFAALKLDIGNLIPSKGDFTSSGLERL